MIDIRNIWKAGTWILVVVIVLACSGQRDSSGSGTKVSDGSVPEASRQALISFDTLSHDFGTIIEGEMVVCYFDYENSGEGDLIISSVEVTCGCTTPDWSGEPLPPGGKGRLKVIFDASGRSGAQRKVVSVLSNASNATVQLTIKANVDNSV